MIKLPWPKHLNCSNFPRHPDLCIKPPPSTASHSSSTSSATAPATFNLPSSHLTMTSKPPLTTPETQPPHSRHRPHHTATPQATDIDFSNLILFVANFIPKLFYYLTFVFAFVVCSALLPFFTFLFYFCLLRIRGNARPADAEDIPLREILGPLPPVPEQ